MTGNQLKIEIKKLDMTQEIAAGKLGITRQTLGIWLKYAEIDNEIMQLVTAKLGIKADCSTSDNPLLDLISSQQRTIENLSETIKNLTSK